MKLNIIPPITILAVSASLLFSGCGDKGPSEADFKKEANAACKTYNTTAKEIEGKFATASANPQDLANLFKEQEEAFEKLVSDLEKVDAPKKQKADFETLIKQAKSGKDFIAKAQAAVASKDQSAIQQLSSEMQKIKSESERLSGSLGLDECGKS